MTDHAKPPVDREAGLLAKVPPWGYGKLEPAPRIYFPIRAAALHEAVRAHGDRYWPESDDPVATILEVAGRFERWLAGELERIPLDPHPYVVELPDFQAAGMCLLATGPGRICGRHPNDSIHQEHVDTRISMRDNAQESASP